MSKQANRQSIIEVLGLPGVGKTTQVNRIHKNNSYVHLLRAHSLLSVRSLFGYLITLPQFLHLPLGISSIKLAGEFKLADILALSQLLWWKRHLSTQSRSTQMITLFDEGPVGILSWSIEFGKITIKLSNHHHSSTNTPIFLLIVLITSSSLS